MTTERPAVGIPVRLAPDQGGSADGPLEVIDDLFEAIVDLVGRAGGRPVRLGTDLREIDACAGFVVPGGGDVDPTRYGGPADDPRLFGVSGRQDELDTAVIRFAAERRRPLLGICRGMQLLNVVHGGTLHVDLAESGVAHRLPPAERFELAVHGVHLVDGSRCAAAYGFRTSIPVTSGHHQGVDRVATGLRASATAVDGLVEALESADPAAWVLGVQWHPETDPTDPELRLPLFIALVDAARGVSAPLPS